MEVQGNETLLSRRDVCLAMLGHEAISDPEFQTYLGALCAKMFKIIPESEMLSADPTDNTPVLRVPYSKKSVEMLSTVIAHGASINTEIEPMVWQLATYGPIWSALNRERYAHEARKRARGRFKIVRDN